MTLEKDWSIQRVAAVIGGVAAAATVPGTFLLAAEAQTSYPDVASDYWARPFIAQLSQADILTGYPDGTFRPEQPIDRDEYAAVIRQAFDAEPVRSISGASTFEDVPEDYWANAAIKEAYEAGFMGTPETDEFEPQTEITRANAIVALVEGIGTDRLSAAAPVATAPAQAARKKATNQLMFPIASTTIMQLFAPPPAQAAPPAAQANGANPDAAAEVPLDLSEYYADADQIPEYARDEVAIATQSGLIVNYPDLRLLNPNQPISRGGTAALIYRALENQGRVEPLPETSETSQYTVDPTLAP